MALIDELEAIVARAAKVTMGTDLTTDADALLESVNPMWTQISERAAELEPVVARIKAALAAELANAPNPTKQALSRYRDDVAEARFDRVAAPHELVAFLILDGLERIDEHCKSKLA